MRRSLPIVLALALAGCDEPTSPRQVPVNLTAVAVGGAHACGLDLGGNVYCWGRASEGQLGAPIEHTASPHRVAAGSRVFEAVTAGQMHTCALASDGEALCWGWNHFGQLGTGNHLTMVSPVTIADSLRFAQLEAGWLHSCGVALTGEGYCWGLNGQGRLGNGTAQDSPAPVRAADGETLLSITVGGSHACAVTADRRGICWGSNAAGQLGDGSYQDSATPVEVEGSNFASISAGYTHTCAISVGGEAFCWGSNSHGELANGERELPGVPGPSVPARVLTKSVDGDGRFVSISAGFHQTCGLAATGSAYCWGSGRWGQTGNGWLVDSALPRQVPMALNTRFVALQSGRGTHTCGVTLRGATYCWGTAEYGGLGVSGVSFSPHPVRVGAR
jgi:alpha-tubulin suppressor-like RCC1 family protein